MGIAFIRKIILVFLLSASATSTAQVLRLIVPFAVGGPMDLFARQVQQDLSRELNLNVVLDHKLGAGGDIATQTVLNTNPREPVLMIQSLAVILNTIIKKQNFDTEQLTPIVGLGTQSLVLVVKPESRLKTIAAWQQLSSDTVVSHAHGGLGSATFICGEILKREIKKNIIDVPFKGGQSEQVMSVLSGTVDASCVWTSPAASYIEQKKLYPVAVVAQTRVPELPNTPTFKELGIQHLDFQPFAALFMNPGIDNKIKTQIQNAMIKILSNKETRKPYENLGLIVPKNPKLDNNFIQTQKQIYNQILQNIKIDQ